MKAKVESRGAVHWGRTARSLLKVQFLVFVCSHAVMMAHGPPAERSKGSDTRYSVSVRNLGAHRPQIEIREELNDSERRRKF
jgi:hypothetical protein